MRQVAGEPPSTKLDHKMKSRFPILAFKAFLNLISTTFFSCYLSHIQLAWQLTGIRTAELSSLGTVPMPGFSPYRFRMYSHSLPAHSNVSLCWTFIVWELLNHIFGESEGNGNETSFPRNTIVWVGTTKRENCFHQETSYINEKRYFSKNPV